MATVKLTANVGSCQLRYYTDGRAECWVGGKLMWTEAWASDWTHMLPYRAFGKDMLLSYKEGAGDAALDEIRSDGWTSGGRVKWRGGWEQFKISYHPNGRVFLISKRPGEEHFDEFTSASSLETLHKFFH